MTHIARGIDQNGILQIDIIVNGNVPSFPSEATVHIEPYSEEYIQTGPGNENLKSKMHNQ